MGHHAPPSPQQSMNPKPQVSKGQSVGGHTPRMNQHRWKHVSCWQEKVVK